MKLIIGIIIFFYYLWCFATELDNPIKYDSSKPIDIEAERIHFNKNTNLLQAYGNVTIKHQGQILVADQVIYYRSMKEILAIGNVSLQRPDGSVFHGEKFRFKRFPIEGSIINLHGKFGKYSNFDAKDAEIKDESVIHATDISYTSCKICEDNFVPNTPLWRLKSRKAVLDKNKERVYFYNMKVELFGKPVGYLPYFSTPMPNTKAKSGLLIPQIRRSDALGKSLRLPIYLYLAENMDATLGININQKKANVYDVQLRHKLSKGWYTFFSSVTYTDKLDKEGNIINNKKDIRGHYQLSGNYNIGEGSLGFYSKKVKDSTQTYLKKYGYGQEDILKTDINYQLNQEDRFFSGRLLNFQDLRPKTSSVDINSTPSALPQITYLYNFKLQPHNADGLVVFDYTNLTRRLGMNYHRIVTKVGLNRNLILPYGVLLKNSVSSRVDHYIVDFRGKVGPQGSETRVHNEFVTSASWPLTKIKPNSQITVSPVFQWIISPNQTNLKKVQNEDSQAPEITASNIFSTNRYKGYDLLENGMRFNYGFYTHWKTNHFDDLSLTAGQTYRFKKDPNLDPSSGMDKHRSDYVLKLNLQKNESLTISEILRINNKNFKFNRHEFGTIFNTNKYRMTFYHFFINKKILENNSQQVYKQEMQITLGANVYRQWWIEGFIKNKLGKRRPGYPTRMIADGIKLKNDNECLSFELGITRDYTKLKDLRPSNSYMFRAKIPNF